ncbi:KCNH8 [Lepeophtheirus salmonis]|uniref:KCNH8 n=1 Tax=Lepeophtheirus salmonis TaxID=72036 RepID=A0A7R8H6H5_LEPSM|nr:KCNH8 [Lepeophtheirus salmonis]CAF2883118.1 KCNH8 [Lepeophtheirus salmonis]
MPVRKGLLAPQNNFLDTIATRFDGTHSNFVLGNAQVPPSFPIVYCSDGFVELSGHTRAHIMQKGCACKFLYGANTKTEGKEKIENALNEKIEIKLEILLYKKNGTSFWCLLDIVPIKNEKRQVVLFLASHKEIPPPRCATIHPGYNTLNVPGINQTGLSNDLEDSYESSNSVENHLLPSNMDPEAPPNYNYGRRRSRAVLYQLSGHYKTDKSKKIHNKLNSSLLSPPSTNIQPLPEYKTSVVKKPRCVLSHYGVIKACWDVIVLCATIYVAIIVPYNAAFKSKNYGYIVIQNKSLFEERWNQTRNYDVVVEAIFLLDIILNFRTTFVNKKGEVVSSSKSIAFNYLKGWFLLDLIAALPFDALELITDTESESFTSIHLLKLTRLLRFITALTKNGPVFTIFSEIEQLENPSTNVSEDVWPGWINLLAERMGLPNGSYVPHSEAYYVTALYYSCTSLTTVGFGNVSANTTWEKIFSVVIMLIGALMHATIFGNVTALVQRLYGDRKSLYQTKWRNLKDFAILHSVPKPLKQRMQDYFQTMWSLNQGIDPIQILQDYPEELRGDVSLHLHKEILSLPIFETASAGCKKLLSLQIKTNFCAPDEFLIHKGDALHNIYYLYNGSMEVLQEGMVVAILGKGDLVGCDIKKHLEPAPLLGGSSEVVVKSSCDVRALTYCDLKCLHIPGMIEILRLYPEFQEQFKEDIQHDLTFNLREGYEAEESSTDNEESVLPLQSISEEIDDVKSNHSNITYLSSEMKYVMEKLERISLSVRPPSINQSVHTTANSTNPSVYQDKSVQTEFPASMLEEYVIKNRKRILRLLGMSSEVANSSSWNPLPSTSSPHISNTPSPTNSCKSNQHPERPSTIVRYNSTPIRTNPRSRVKLLYQQKTLPSISVSLATPEEEERKTITNKKINGKADMPIDGDDAQDEDLDEYAEFIHKTINNNGYPGKYSMKKRHSTGSACPSSFEDWKKIKKRESSLGQGSTTSLDNKPFVTDF